MTSLHGLWEILIAAAKWVTDTARSHPLVSILVTLALVYGWLLTIQVKRGQLREQRRSEEQRIREEQAERERRKLAELEDERNAIALQAFKRGENLDQPTTRRLHVEGLLIVSDVTNMDSPRGEREWLATDLTEKGDQLLERFKKDTKAARVDGT